MIGWIQNGTSFKLTEGDIKVISTIPAGIYQVETSPLAEPYLNKVGEKFEFPYKIYDLQSSFLKYLKKTYESTIGNLGVLFNGTKGTGKTVCAKLFANSLNLPVIIVRATRDSKSLMSYLNSFNFDCVLFFDEFEKEFNEADSSILQFMDGVLSSTYRRIFLLTTNSLTINENLLSRPSRIRYIKEFGNLEESVVRAYLKDNLKDTSITEEVVSYVDTLVISTIDILKTIVEEINIHGMDKFLEAKSFFNIKTGTFTYHVHRACINLMTSKPGDNYTIVDFLKDIEVFEARRKEWDVYSNKLAATKTFDERLKINEELDKLYPIKNTITTNYYEFDKVWNKHQIGKDIINDDEVVIAIDNENKVIVTKNDAELLTFYHIISERRPSLYTAMRYPKVL